MNTFLLIMATSQPLFVRQTGEVAQRFEERAQANYQRYLNRTEEQKKADEAILEKKFAELYSMLSKAHLGRR